jgi:hypothetical protein
MNKRFIAFIPADAFFPCKGMRVSIVFENESGHFPTGGAYRSRWDLSRLTPRSPLRRIGEEPWYYGNINDAATSYEEACRTAEEWNASRGISPEEAQKILDSSMMARP